MKIRGLREEDGIYLHVDDIAAFVDAWGDNASNELLGPLYKGLSEAVAQGIRDLAAGVKVAFEGGDYPQRRI